MCVFLLLSEKYLLNGVSFVHKYLFVSIQAKMQKGIRTVDRSGPVQQCWRKGFRIIAITALKDIFLWEELVALKRAEF